MEKCIVLFSGGLDSRLAVKIMQERGYDIIALHFNLPFGCSIGDIKELQMKGVDLVVLDATKGELSKEYIDVIKNAKHGVGAGCNPCKDCKIFMFKKAKEYADSKRITIIATGEVLGQRPMSQTKKAMDVIDNEIGFKLTRPLIELGILGRRRDKQIALAKKYKITYPSPAGGCLLCEKGLKSRFKLLIKNNLINEETLPLMRVGRHFINSKRWIILGRNSIENGIIEKQPGIKVIPQQPGPTAWMNDEKLVNKSEKLIKKYSKHEIKEFDILK